MGVVENVQSILAVPLRHKGKVLGALNLLSDHKDAFTERDEAMLRQFARTRGAGDRQCAAVRVRTRVCARRSRRLAEIGREMSAILDLDELLTRAARTWSSG